MKCDIIMPVWDNLELTRQCIDSIFDNTHCDYKLIIVDNGSGRLAQGYLQEIESGHQDKVVLIRNNENLGFTRAVNQGLKNSSADYSCVINNDIIVSNGWLEEMIRVASSRQDIGIVTPSNNFGKKKPKDKTYQQYAEEATKGMQGRFCETASPAGFCYLIKKEVIDKIGLLDERFSPGYFEDTEYALRAKKAGYKSVFASGAFVFHREHSSFKKRGFNRLFKQSEEKFYRMYKRPGRILFILSRPGSGYYDKVSRQAYGFACDANWVSVFLKKSSPEINLPNHTYIRAFRFADALFGMAVALKVLFKKKRFTKIFADDERFLGRLAALKKYHKDELEVISAGAGVAQ